MILGDLAGEDATAAMLCAEVGAVVVSVEYRLAPEHPHRAPVKDPASTCSSCSRASPEGTLQQRLRIAHKHASLESGPTSTRWCTTT
jgi:acetyl esterase/lipase